MNIQMIRAGLMPYPEAMKMQKKFADELKGGRGMEILLLLEHPPVITLGLNATGKNLIVSEASLASRGIKLFRADRGGDITWHGPGQVVAYPVMDLTNHHLGVREYVRKLEELMIKCCLDFGLVAGRKAGMAGTWIMDKTDLKPACRKIGAVGVHVSKGISTHGIALNICPDMDFYNLINPCGITEYGVTSMELELGRNNCPDTDTVMQRMGFHFADIFNVRILCGQHRLFFER